MKPVIELTINNKPLDLGNTNLNLKYFIFDPNDLGARGTAISYSFNIPVSKYNLGILGIRINDWQTINNYKVFNVAVVVSSDTILEGLLELEGYSEGFIKANFKSSQWDWAKTISSLDLKDLKHYKAPYSYIAHDVDEASIDAYTNSRGPGDHINFPVVPRGYMYRPRIINVYQLDGNGNRLQSPPDGSYKLSEQQVTVTIIDGTINTLINLKEGYYRLIEQTTGDLYDCELFIKPNFTNTELSVFNYEDVVPSFYVSSILKKIFIDQNIRVQSSLFEDPILKDLMITYSGEEFQWNRERFGTFIGRNTEGRSKILDTYEFRLPPPGCPPPNYPDWSILSGWMNGGFCGGFGDLPLSDYDSYSNDTQMNRPSAGFSKVKKYFILNIPDRGDSQNLGGDYYNYYRTTEFRNRQGFFYRARVAGEYTFKVKLDYTIVNPQPNQTGTTNMLALVKGDIKFNSDQGISETSRANDNLVYNVVSGTTEGSGAGSLIYFKSMQNPGFNTPYAGGTVEFTCTTYLEENAEVTPVFIGHRDPDDAQTNTVYKATNFELVVKPTQSDWDIDIAKNLPEQSQLDFVKDILFLFNLYPEYDLVTKTLRLLTLDECLAKNIINLNERSSIIDAEQNAINQYKVLNLGYSEDTSDLLIKDYRKLNYYKEDNTKLDNYDYLVEYAAGKNTTFLAMYGRALSLPAIEQLTLEDNINYINYDMLAMRNKEASQIPYYDVQWTYDFKSKLGIFNKSKEWRSEIFPNTFLGGTPTFTDLDVVETTPLMVYQATGNNRSTGNILSHPSGDFTRTPMFGGDVGNVFRRNVAVLDFNYYYINNLAVLNFHPLLDFNNAYEKFYKYLADKNSDGYKVTIKTRLRYTEFKDIVKGGIRKVKWNNDYYLLLEIDKYDLDSEMGELTLLKAIGF